MEEAKQDGEEPLLQRQAKIHQEDFALLMAFLRDCSKSRSKLAMVSVNFVSSTSSGHRDTGRILMRLGRVWRVGRQKMLTGITNSEFQNAARTL